MKPFNGVARKPAMRGFSLIEMMVVIVIVSIVVAAVLTQVDQTQQRAAAEENKLDQFEDARNFVDQIAIDARQMGYPNSHNFDVSGWPTPLNYSTQLATGLVKLTTNSLRFEGDIDGSGTVYEVSYKVNGNGNCATCLERAQVPKSPVDPLAQAPAVDKYTTEIQNVQNANSASNPIFRAFDSSGNQITLPIDIGSAPAAVAQVRVIQISLDISNPTKRDPKTNQPLEANIISRVQVVNCSMATTIGSLPSALQKVQNSGGTQFTCQ
jgi:prepilin-type N-terminal cleavage/methylation domain-containing protein